MVSEGEGEARTVDGIPIGRLILRILWLALRLMAVSVLIQQGTTFFYEGF